MKIYNNRVDVWIGGRAKIALGSVGSLWVTECKLNTKETCGWEPPHLLNTKSDQSADGLNLLPNEMET